MKYSFDFKKRCKDLYPEYNRLHELLDTGSLFVRDYLQDACGMINEDEILSAISLQDLKEKALIIKKKKGLYKEWLNLYNIENK